MDLDVGNVGLTSHTHVPAMGVQSWAQSDDLSACTGHSFCSCSISKFLRELLQHTQKNCRKICLDRRLQRVALSC